MINFLLILFLITSTFITTTIASVIAAKIFEAIRDEIYDIKFRKMLEKAEEEKEFKNGRK